MLVTEQKPVGEILGALDGAKSVLLVGCNGCPLGWDSGGPAKLAELAEQLAKGGKEVAGSVMIDFLCNKALVGLKLTRHLDELKKADAVIVSSCGVGVQATAEMVDKPCHPCLNTMSSMSFQGLWPSSERCGQCGDCVLSLTAGICPITTCAKNLINGSCGGSHKGTCEVDSKRACGWFRIYERLKEQGRLDNLKKLPYVRDHQRMDIPMAQRSTIRWAIEA
jgi:hypothetical protein